MGLKYRQSRRRRPEGHSAEATYRFFADELLLELLLDEDDDELELDREKLGRDGAATVVGAVRVTGAGALVRGCR